MFDDLRSMLVLDHLWSLLVPDLPTALWSCAFAGSVVLVVGSLPISGKTKMVLQFIFLINTKDCLGISYVDDQ